MYKKITLATSLLLISTSFIFAEQMDQRDSSVTKDKHMMTSSTTMPAMKDKKVIDLSCAVSSIDKRESALIAAHGKYNDAIIAMLSARKDALKTAWGNADKSKRQVASKEAWSASRVSTQKAHTDLRTSRKSAWDAFNVDMKACGVSHAESPISVGNPSTSL